MPSVSGVAARALSAITGVADGQSKVARVSKYGEQMMQPITEGTYALSDEGAYFKAMFTAAGPVPGAAFALTGATTTAFSHTAVSMTIRNTDASAALLAKRIYIDYIRFLVTTAGTAGTRLEGAISIDNATRYSSGGSALTIVNANMDSATASIAAVHAGAITAGAAGGSARLTHRFTLSAANPAVGDAYLLNLGRVGDAPGTIGKVASCGPVILGPNNHTALLHLWLPTQSAAPTGELEIGWWER